MAQDIADTLPRHVAIIMDGNGRWAKNRGLNRIMGHRKGVQTVKTIVRAAREIGVPYLTLYAFSEENWRRPKTEIRSLMLLLKRFLKKELDEMLENGIRLNHIGRIEKLPPDVGEAILETERKTTSNRNMVLTLALSYGGRQEILDALRRMGKDIRSGALDPEALDESRFSDYLTTADMPDPDLLIRTSGEYRISNFLLWQIAYTELYFTPTLWPDFGEADFLMAIDAYRKRERRFGALP